MKKHSSQILIVDDNPRDIDFLCHLLSNYNVVCVANGTDALFEIGRMQSPLIISDIQMPGIDGIALAKNIWQSNPEARIIIWSQYDDEMYVRSLAKIIPPETVYGYILKNNRSKMLSKAINAVFEESQCWIDPKVRPVQARLARSDSALSDRECEALIDIALGLKDNAIAERRYLSRRGVQNRLKSLYAKLGIELDFPESETGNEMANPRTRAISIALRRGLINAYVIKEEEEKLHAWLEKSK